MKKYFFPILIGGAALFTASSCKKIIDNLIPPFDVTIRDIPVTIPVVVGSSTTFGAQDVNFNLDSAIKKHTAGQFGASDIKSLKMKNITIYLANNDDLNNMSNFSSASLQFSSNSNTTPATITTATIPDTPSSSLSVDCSSSPDLQSYLTGNKFSFMLTGQVRRPTTHELTANVSITFTIQ